MKLVKDTDVVDGKTFVMYAHQRSGIPYPSHAELGKANKKLRELFEQYPGLTFAAMCRMVDWSVSQRKRFYNSLQLIDAGTRIAWTKGVLPEMDASVADVDEEERVRKLLAEPYLPEDWRRRFTLAQTAQERSAVLDLWDAEGA